MLAAFVLAAMTCHAPATTPARTIHGVFVEVDNACWKDIAQSKQIDTIVIANIRGYGPGCTPCDRVKFEQARRLLATAREGMKIYVGLVYDADFDIMKSDGARERKAARDFYTTLTEKQKSRITGWYIAGEWHNASAAKYGDAVVTYLKKATDRSDPKTALPPGEVIVAPFFVAREQPWGTCSDVLGAPETATLFERIVSETKITRFLLQDGFGARNKRTCKWGNNVDDYARTAKTYADAIREKLPDGVYEVDLEAFGNTGKKQCRLDLQFANVPAGTRVIVYEKKACRKTRLCQ